MDPNLRLGIENNSQFKRKQVHVKGSHSSNKRTYERILREMAQENAYPNNIRHKSGNVPTKATQYKHIRLKKVDNSFKDQKIRKSNDIKDSNYPNSPDEGIYDDLFYSINSKLPRNPRNKSANMADFKRKYSPNFLTSFNDPVAFSSNSLKQRQIMEYQRRHDAIHEQYANLSSSSNPPKFPNDYAEMKNERLEFRNDLINEDSMLRELYQRDTAVLRKSIRPFKAKKQKKPSFKDNTVEGSLSFDADISNYLDYLKPLPSAAGTLSENDQPVENVLEEILEDNQKTPTKASVHGKKRPRISDSHRRSSADLEFSDEMILERLNKEKSTIKQQELLYQIKLQAIDQQATSEISWIRKQKQRNMRIGIEDHALRDMEKSLLTRTAIEKAQIKLSLQKLRKLLNDKKAKATEIRYKIRSGQSTPTQKDSATDLLETPGSTSSKKQSVDDAILSDFSLSELKSEGESEFKIEVKESTESLISGKENFPDAASELASYVPTEENADNSISNISIGSVELHDVSTVDQKLEPGLVIEFENDELRKVADKVSEDAGARVPEEDIPPKEAFEDVESAGPKIESQILTKKSPSDIILVLEDQETLPKQITEQPTEILSSKDSASNIAVQQIDSHEFTQDEILVSDTSLEKSFMIEDLSQDESIEDNKAVARNVEEVPGVDSTPENLDHQRKNLSDLFEPEIQEKDKPSKEISYVNEILQDDSTEVSATEGIKVIHSIDSPIEKDVTDLEKTADALTQSILEDIIRDSIDHAEVAMDRSREPEINVSVEPESVDFKSLPDVIHDILSTIPDGKYKLPPYVTYDSVEEGLYLYNNYRLGIDLVNEAMYILFQPHESYYDTKSLFRKRRQICPPALSKDIIKTKLMKIIDNWTSYSEREGENMDFLLTQEILDEEKDWLDLETQGIDIQSKITDAIFEEVLWSTYEECSRHISLNSNTSLILQ